MEPRTYASGQRRPWCHRHGTSRSRTSPAGCHGTTPTIVGNAFAAGDVRHVDTNQLADEINSLGDQAKQIKPRLTGRERVFTIDGDEEAGAVIRDDPLSDLITVLTGNIFPRLTTLDNPAALAAHLSDQVIAESLRRAQEEPWRLLGYDTFPESLKSLETDLRNLLAVVATLAADSSSNARLVRAARGGVHRRALRRAADAARQFTKRQLQARKTQLEQIGKELSQPLRAYMPRDDQAQFVSDRLIAVNVASLIDWPNVLERINTAFQAARLPAEKFMIVPIREGRPVAPLAINLISSFIPARDLGHWTSLLRKAHETPLTNAFDSAIDSLQVASGVLALPEQQRSHEIVDQVAANAKNDFHQSLQTLEQAPRDTNTEQIAQLLESLNDALIEEEAGQRAGGDIARQLSQIATGHQTELTIAVSVTRLMALEWDIHRDTAEQLLETD